MLDQPFFPSTQVKRYYQLRYRREAFDVRAITSSVESLRSSELLQMLQKGAVKPDHMIPAPAH